LDAIENISRALWKTRRCEVDSIKRFGGNESGRRSFTNDLNEVID
jgi:hypothetical protein